MIDEVYSFFRPTLEKGGLFFMTKMPSPWLYPKQKSDKVVHIKMTQSQLDTLRFASKKLNMTMSELVRISITEYLCKQFMI